MATRSLSGRLTGIFIKLLFGGAVMTANVILGLPVALAGGVAALVTLVLLVPGIPIPVVVLFTLPAAIFCCVVFGFVIILLIVVSCIAAVIVRHRARRARHAALIARRRAASSNSETP